MHLLNLADKTQNIYIDTPKAESKASNQAGFFRQSWGVQILELQKFSRDGLQNRVFFADNEGSIPEAKTLKSLKIKIFVGVGHETTGATTYSEQDVKNLLEWIDLDPKNHHAIIDATSLLGAMIWPDNLCLELTKKTCFFMPFQKAIGGVAGYFLLSLTPYALKIIDNNIQNPSFAIARQLKLFAPQNAKKPLSSKKTLTTGPFFDAKSQKMLGGVINTFSIKAFAETRFGLLRMEKLIGDVKNMNHKSLANLKTIEKWVEQNTYFELVVTDKARRGAAVILLKIIDNEITNKNIHKRIIIKAKQLLSYAGITHINGAYEAPLDSARYVNVFPGTPGDFRAWIGSN